MRPFGCATMRLPTDCIWCALTRHWSWAIEECPHPGASTNDACKEDAVLWYCTWIHCFALCHRNCHVLLTWELQIGQKRYASDEIDEALKKKKQEESISNVAGSKRNENPSFWVPQLIPTAEGPKLEKPVSLFLSLIFTFFFKTYVCLMHLNSGASSTRWQLLNSSCCSLEGILRLQIECSWSVEFVFQSYRRNSLMWMQFADFC